MEESGKHLFTSEQKIKWWGYGEWVEEPDELEFQHEDFKCRIRRIYAPEMNGSMFGGYLCGYVCIPEDHVLYKKDYNEIDIDVHGGLTWSKLDKDGYWIGFDCAHSIDYSPSIEYLYKTMPEMIEIRERARLRLLDAGIQTDPFKSTYRNISYCIEECKSMVSQLKTVNKEI